MASLAQVRAQLAVFVQDAVYPNGIGQPSVADVGISIRPGWPPPNYMENTLRDGKVLVSIWEPQGSEKNATRFNKKEIAINEPTATLTLTVSANTITVGGTITADEIAIVIVNKDYGNPYSYTVQSSDTVNIIAAELASIIPNASAVNNVITITDSYNLVGRISIPVTLETNLKRQNRLFWLINWSPSITIRDSVSNAIDIALGDTDYITLDELYSGRIIYQSHWSDATLEKQNCYRDYFSLTVEWETVKTTQVYTIEDVYTPIEVTSSLT